jgi:hypothetical protein
MTVDCQWVENNLEALFCDSLNEEQTRLARAHIDNCVACREETQMLNAIDPVIKQHFRRELAIARRPRAVNTRRVFGVSGAALAVVAILLFAVTRPPQTNPVTPPLPSQSQIAPTASVVPPPPIKNDAPSEDTGRAKPIPGVDRVTGLQSFVPPPVAVSPNAPDFIITDPAGYSHTAEEYRGHVVVIGIWSDDQPEATANLDWLYRAYASNTKLRFFGVSNSGQTKPANTTFPVVYNQGSKVFGAQSGDFVVLDENGSVELRGSLVKDFDSIRRLLQGK